MRLSLLLLLVLLTTSSSASYNGLSDELRSIHQEMGALRAENQKQNMVIADLKEAVLLQNKTINQHEATIKELFTDDHRMNRNDRPVESAAMLRHERPARLLPSTILRGKKKNDTDQENRNLFYGPPTNCSDLNRLGYTLNGFYMVKKPTNDMKSVHTTMLDAVYCAFKQEGTFDPSLVEKPVVPSPFTSPLSQMNHAFHSPMLPSDDDVYFLFTAVRDTKDQFGVLTFNPSNFNKGNGFNGTTGYFKAPKFGIYHFLYETEPGNRGNGTSIDFYMNDVLIANTLSSISRESTIFQVTLKLKPLDSVCLKATTKNSSNGLSTVPRHVFSERVMGFLVKPTLFF